MPLWRRGICDSSPKKPLDLTKVFCGRPETRIKPEGLSIGTTISSRRDFSFLGWEGGFAVDAEHLVDAFFFVFGIAVGSADALEMAVGDIIENDAAAEGKLAGFLLAKCHRHLIANWRIDGEGLGLSLCQFDLRWG